ncbi:FumA C-terminus/TtdB family hydratase beta subunit [Culicoidibacter larvae]|uniref:TRZ/ATZ family protein n=1 Tax=Culicoidibacter larvae TaxID=2579976 RepID=A0A5R8QIP7_9FIRM|nr:FumA C-terminus/TtdB family hydratase beta subunit [Culicoidibacter larvae]TLG77323.1 TRZ/ATZ family protein [Culicoidibacter larvae]
MKTRDLITPLDTALVADLRSGEKILISGTIYVARDAAHKRIGEMLEAGLPLPVDLKNQIIYYMGPSPAIGEEVIGSCGPTTSARMDPYTEMMLDLGVKLFIGKGERAPYVEQLLQEHGAVYAIAVGGAAVYLQQFVKTCECIAFEELGAEALYRLEVENFEVFVANDVQGNTIFQ